MERSVIAVVGAAMATVVLAGCGSTTTTTAAPAAATTTAVSVLDRAAGLGPASHTPCAEFLAKNVAGKEEVLRQVIAENPNWNSFGLSVPWAEMNCKGDGKEKQAIGVALAVSPSTIPNFQNVATMTCRDFLIQDTDDDTGILIMQQLATEKPESVSAGPFPALIMVRNACKKPDAANKTIGSIAN
ncbi:hypothetical protein [Nocardia tengchongensis]|uniref:hypothetical protein n=1 Tax=Nocardia tengchongensis TaxID=2055889 RepID=UPI00365A5193